MPSPKVSRESQPATRGERAGSVPRGTYRHAVGGLSRAAPSSACRPCVRAF